jgi:hypothetical protein
VPETQFHELGADGGEEVARVGVKDAELLEWTPGGIVAVHDVDDSGAE